MKPTVTIDNCPGHSEGSSCPITHNPSSQQSNHFPFSAIASLCMILFLFYHQSTLLDTVVSLAWLLRLSSMSLQIYSPLPPLPSVRLPYGASLHLDSVATSVT